MSQQLTLDGFDPPPRATDRLFFALLPEASAAQRIAALARQLKAEHGLRGRPLATSRLHVTLHFFGDHAGLPQVLVDGVSRAASELRHAPFDVTFDRVASFAGRPRKRPFVLRGSDDGLSELTTLRRKLGDALARHGFARLVDARFTPHVTLLYDDTLRLEQPVEPVRWRVSEFVLIDSLLGQTKHVPLARWQLSG